MRKILAILCLLLACPGVSLATAFGAKTAWDVRTTGNDTNGGAFDSGVASPGTDRSTSAAVAFTDLIVGATTTQGTSVTLAFDSTSPGNFIHIASGAGCNTGWFEMSTQSGGTVTFNASLGTAASTCTGRAYGSLATVAQAFTNSVAGNTVWLQKGTYTVTSTQTMAVGETLAGYQTSHSDLNNAPLWSTLTSNAPTITTSTNSVSPLIKISTGTTTTAIFRNLLVSTTAGTTAEAFATGNHGNTLIFEGVKISGGFTKNIDCDNGTYFDCANVWIFRSEITGGTALGIYLNPVAGCTFVLADSYVHNNAGGTGITGQVASNCNTFIDRSIVASSTSGPNVAIGGSQLAVSKDSVFYKAAASNVLLSSGDLYYEENSVNYGAATDGIQGCVSASYVFVNYDGMGGNTNVDSDGCALDNKIALSADPVTNAPGGDFSLNSTAGGGAALKAAGFPGSFPGSTTGTPDVGAAQTACAAGGGSSGSMCVQ